MDSRGSLTKWKVSFAGCCFVWVSVAMIAVKTTYLLKMLRNSGLAVRNSRATKLERCNPTSGGDVEEGSWGSFLGLPDTEIHMVNFDTGIEVASGHEHITLQHIFQLVDIVAADRIAPVIDPMRHVPPA
ncbi:hypothetical protein KC338_g168 [Hortaea werneckii]|nr:hypothetical protein KC338_g168 [Hortaea werneckii]